MDLGLKGKVAIVSGASKGVGRQIALELASEGAKVVLVARGKEGVDAAAAEVAEKNGGHAIGVAADMTDAAGIAHVVKETEAKFGSADIVISNVASRNRYGFDDCVEDDFRVSCEQLVVSLVTLYRATTPQMIAKGWGRFVNIGSLTMRQARRDPLLILSNTFRLGVVGLNKSMSDELAPHGITVNTLASGWFKTQTLLDAHRSQPGNSPDATWEDVERARGGRVPMGRIGEPSEMSSVCTFLCSKRASYITGQVITVDGGRTTNY